MISKEQVNAWVLSHDRTADELTTLLGVIKGALESGSYDGQLQKAFAAGVSEVDAAEKEKLGR